MLIQLRTYLAYTASDKKPIDRRRQIVTIVKGPFLYRRATNKIANDQLSHIHAIGQ